jgi:uncharacterized FlaG/YvyC family protein
MDTGVSIRPVPPVSLTAVRVAPPAERQTAVTELPATETVTAVPEDPAVSARPDDQANALRGQIEEAFQRRARIAGETVSKVTQDQDTKELVFSKISAETGKVIGQFPDEAMLRLKAYNAQVAKRAEAEAAARVI